MSIVIRSNELNCLIYKYFQEAGLNHTAYALFNEANLSQSLQQFKYDIKAGHLISILERGLIYTQIQSHVNFNQYQECKESIQLIKSHTCKITQKIKQEKEQFMQELTDKITDGMKRTNAIYSTAIANDQYNQIVYEAKGSKYFDKFCKIRLPTDTTEEETQNCNSENRFTLNGHNNILSIYDSEDNCINILKHDTLTQEITVDRIIPCFKNQDFSKIITFSANHQQIIEIFQNNQITLIKNTEDNTLEQIQFQSTMISQITSVQYNPSFNNLVCFSSNYQYEILNLQNMKYLSRGKGKLQWREFDEFLLLDENGELTLRSVLKREQKIITFNTYQSQIEEIRLSQSKLFFTVVSYVDKKILVYTFEKNQPLYMFDLGDEKQLKQVMWLNSKSVDYLCWLTSDEIKIFDLALNSFSKIIQVNGYDSAMKKMFELKNGEEGYMLCLGKENILVYDVSNGKIERMEVQGTVKQMKEIGSEKIAVITNSYLYLIEATQILPLFK